MHGRVILLLVVFHISRCIEEASHDRTLRNTLKKPNITSWELDSHYLMVNWKHSDDKQQVQGYYILLCRLVNSRCTGPDFVNFDKNARSGKIVGLAPEAMYQVEVIAYTGEEHVSSDQVIVSTQRLEFLLARNLTVSHVTCCSAVFYWKHEPNYNIHDVKFLLLCKGKRKYINVHKKLINEDHIFQQSSPSTSRDVEAYFVGKLEPNTKYVCSVSSISGSIHSPSFEQVSFTTHPGTPSAPPTPLLSLGRDHTFTASLYPTDERFGPVSHYLLIAVPVSKSESDPLTAPYQPIVPLKNLLLKALSSKRMVTMITQPVPFIVASFGSDALPVNYKFGYEWRSVFKQKTHYSVVLVAFTKGEDSKVFQALSAPSSPVYITEDLVATWLREQQPVAKKLTIIVVSSIFALVILFTVVFLILFISNYYYAKRRDAKEDYMFAISSDEEEIFSKGANQGTKLIPVRKMTTLSKRSPNMSHADWAVENMSRSPAFREMVEKHPEALDEDVMSSIGHKWEINQYNTNSNNRRKKQKPLTSDSSLTEPIYSSRQSRQSLLPTVSSQRTSYMSQGETMSDVDLKNCSSY